ncbi:MAG: type II toxin-antitoxin system VapC family toxin [Boseongicola sp. SB0662_bin_57]|nr:type II toxin-antitoxin system VapC family toxin [Boseongicola sp. SB0662_bin_57]
MRTAAQARTGCQSGRGSGRTRRDQARSVIYLDTSVALAWLLTEDRQPPVSVWDGTLVSSRLLEYEIWTPLHSRGIADSHGEAARQLIGRVALLELPPQVLARALDAFPAPLRTLDALHLASCAYLADQGQNVELASYDRRMNEVARAMDIPLFNPEAA